MATLSVWKFDTPDGAKEAEELLLSLQKQGLVTLDDAAIVYWEPGKRAPKTRQLHNLAAVGALGGTFWGVLFGLLFFVPILGAAVGAAAGAVGGALTDVGIDDDFIRSVRDTITEGTSALFLLTESVVIDKTKDAFAEKGLRPELVHTNLSDAEERQLREIFAE